MSWDFLVFSADTPLVAGPGGAAIFADDFQPRPLGPCDSIRADLSAVFPALEWTDPA